MTTELDAAIYLAEHRRSNYNRRAVVFNPADVPVAELPVIYAFSNVKGGGDGLALALAQDGTVLGEHWCSHEGYVENDLGVLEGRSEDRHEDYRRHYPSGYRMEFVRAADVRSHQGIEEAYRLNQLQADHSSAVQSDA